MNTQETGRLLSRLRKERGLTQRQLAEALHVSAQAVSKWECGLGCPDVSLLTPLAGILGVSARCLLAGDLSPNDLEVGNLKKLKIYVCPDCGNVITAAAEGEFHCCGRKLEPLVPRPVDEAHQAVVQPVEEDLYVTFSHPMEKDHFIRFALWLGIDRMLLVRLYPEQGGEFRIPNLRGGGKLYLCCSKDGLFEVPL